MEDSNMDSHHKPKGITIPTFTTKGGMTKACCKLGAGGSLVQVAEMATQLYEVWFSKESDINRVQGGMGPMQPAPFPLLTINVHGNTVSILHGVKNLWPPSGFNMNMKATFWPSTKTATHRPSLNSSSSMARNGMKPPTGSTLTYKPSYTQTPSASRSSPWPTHAKPHAPPRSSIWSPSS